MHSILGEIVPKTQKDENGIQNYPAYPQNRLQQRCVSAYEVSRLVTLKCRLAFNRKSVVSKLWCLVAIDCLHVPALLCNSIIGAFN